MGIGLLWVHEVFSTHVEVALPHLRTKGYRPGLLHAGGGTPLEVFVYRQLPGSSPRAWRYPVVLLESYR